MPKGLYIVYFGSGWCVANYDGQKFWYDGHPIESVWNLQVGQLIYKFKEQKYG